VHEATTLGGSCEVGQGCSGAKGSKKKKSADKIK